MIVLDTSALVEFLVGADVVAERVRAEVQAEQLAAPHAIDLECTSTLRGLVLGSKLPGDEARRALDLVASMNIRRFGHVRCYRASGSCATTCGRTTPPMSHLPRHSTSI